MKESGKTGGPVSAGCSARIGLSFNWTRAEKIFRHSNKLDGSDAKSYHPIRLGLELVGQYSSLPDSWGVGLGPTVVLGDGFYLNGAFLLNAEGRPSYFLGLGLRDFLK